MMKFSYIILITCLTPISISKGVCQTDKNPLNNEMGNTTNIDLANAKLSNNSSSARLPHDLFPVNYKIRLQPYLNGNLSINGSIEIVFHVAKATDKVILNMVDIMSRNETCKVIQLNNHELESNPVIVNQTYEPYNQKYIIQLNRNLTKGYSYRLSLDFVAYLNDKLVGFYLSTYEDSSGNVWRLAATQFSPTDARRAFPCFDEPLFKATFDIVLVRQRNMTAWSNMPINATKQLLNGWVEDHFNRTLRMSTYLVGFLISNFNSTKSNYLNDTAFSVLTREEAANQTAYALFLAPRCLEYFEKYFKIKYPLPKLHMAAIPDFKFSGMENWGLITYREAAMLFDKTVTTVGSKRYIASVIAHEIAHQWFGNLVTPEWWSDLWLKEGFATYMGALAADAVEPSWKMMDSLIYDDLHSAFQLDSLRSSHPINVDVDHPDRITQAFDAISYEKGSSIIRMMQHFITEDAYKRGMTSYLENLKFKNAKQEDLWQFLTTAWSFGLNHTRDASVKTVMDSWTLQQGYPVVIVTMHDNDAILRQEPFLLEGNLFHTAADFNTSKYGIDRERPAKLSNATWWIPISYTTQHATNFSQTMPALFMNPAAKQATIKNVSKDSWILVNVQKTGFYRVNYDQEMWRKLSHQLKTNHSAIHYLNRAQLIDDSINLARSGKLPYSIAIDIMSYLKKEKDLTPWKTFFNNFGYVLKQARFSEVDGPLKQYVRPLLSGLYESLGFEDKPEDTYDIQSLRSELSSWACKLGQMSCLLSSQMYFHEWLNGTGGSFSNIRNIKPVMLCYGIKHSNESQWNKTLDRYGQSNIQTEKIDILDALGCTNNTKILQRFARMALNQSTGIRKQDSSRVFSSVSNTPAGRNITWSIIKENWNFIVNYFGQGSSSPGKILASTTRTFDTEVLLDEFLNFTIIHKKDLASVKQKVDQSFEGAIMNNVWKSQLLPELIEAARNKIFA